MSDNQTIARFGMTLSWGKRYLMCPPDYYDVVYAINPWMDPTARIDRELARSQWNTLVATIEEAGGVVDTVTPQPGLPDMVFTANAGIVSGGTFVPARMRHPERSAESACVAERLVASGMSTALLSAVVSQEGAGDALPMAGTLVGGYGPRSSPGAYEELSRLITAPILPVHLPDERWYHIDIALCPLDERRAIVVPEAFAPTDAARVLDLVHEPLTLTLDEAAQFTANSIVVGTTVVMPACPPRVGRILEGWGFDVAVVDVSQFLLAGGACRCLTLALDVDLGTAVSAGTTVAARPSPVSA